MPATRPRVQTSPRQTPPRPQGHTAFPVRDAPFVRHRIAADGHTLRWTETGRDGPPLLVLPGWTSHLTIDWANGPVAAFHRRLSSGFRVLRYDPPGMGLSGGESGEDCSLPTQVDHAAAVIEASGRDQVAVFATGFAGPVAIALAADRPELVSKVVLFGTAASFLADEENPDGLAPAVPEAVERLVRADWRLGSRVIAELLLPGAAPDEVLWYGEYQRMAASAEAAAALLRADCSLDAREHLARLRAPLLALRRQDCHLATAGVQRRLVHRVPDGRSRTLPGAAALPYFDGTDGVLSEITAFLRPAHGRLTARELTVLTRLRAGLSNRAIARELGISEHTTARHLANVNVKLGVNSRGAAVARAMELSLL